jgi:uncharacterized protein YbcV (DUF1398 family)
MEFSLQAIQEAHSKYTGPDFPKLIREFKSMGMVTNIYDLSSGMILYVDKDGNSLESQGTKSEVAIAEPSNEEEALAALKRNQTGVTDFPTFCSEMVQAGVYKWVSDLEEMTCSYYDLQEKAIIVEEIPSI